MAQSTAERNGWTQFVAMQCHYNLIYREKEREVIRYCRQTGVGILSVLFSPLKTLNIPQTLADFYSGRLWLRAT